MHGNAHVIVVGNEKGGTGKSTVAMHVIVSLLNMGLRVGSVDLDARQSTLTHYVENRRHYTETHGAPLALPDHEAIAASDVNHTGEVRQEDIERLTLAMARLVQLNDVVVIDTPGSDHYLSRAGHVYADTLLTPLNDSLIDLDVLARVDPDTMRILRPSHYSEMVWEIKKQKAMRGGGSIQWIVTRNRLAHLDARNKRDMDQLLTALAKRIGFKLVAGLGERVVYRELFLKGLTLLDLREASVNVSMRMSHVAARQELRSLVDAMGLPMLAEQVRSGAA
ncbi:MAG: division plane positioning ATPase MipZ [Alphaproteobacteria bacterium]